MVQKAKNIFEECNIQQKVEPVLGDAVKAAGIGFLLASNCFKDVGAVLLIADSVIEDPTDVTNDIVVLIFVALLGRQAYADCQQFIHFVLWFVHLIWFKLELFSIILLKYKKSFELQERSENIERYLKLLYLSLASN